jgi:hypothetical protein
MSSQAPVRDLDAPAGRSATEYGHAVRSTEPSHVRFEVTYQERYARATAPFKWLLLAPHTIALLFVELAMVVAWVVSAVAVVATGRYPRGLFDFNVGGARWLVRYAAYLYLLTDAYPPFALYDQPSYPVRFALDYPPGGRVARWRPLFAWALVLPQLVLLVVLYTAMLLLVLVAAGSIVFSGRYPRSAFDIVVRTLRFHSRVNAYGFFMTQRYPSFGA